jgi:hypothetical protein
MYYLLFLILFEYYAFFSILMPISATQRSRLNVNMTDIKKKKRNPTLSQSRMPNRLLQSKIDTITS